mgnify:CR=1 FL=1|jgi:hypothetical protein|tara:strand:- start:1279 stop:1488 length:210 start_codon:yes stop_codon:yes gene_type:complete
MLSKQCKAHLEEVGETGLQHMGKALMVALKLQLLVPVVIIHSVAPRFFTKTATNTMRNILNDRKQKTDK